MTRRSGLAAGLRLAVGLAAVPLVGLAAGCGGSNTSKYNAEGLSRDDFEAPKTAPPPPKQEKEDPDDPRARRKKKLAAE
jgi:hypothetical protein